MYINNKYARLKIEKTCRYRGAFAEWCSSCGGRVAKYYCERDSAHVMAREVARADHPNDIGCNSRQCRGFQPITN
jgi:hypothetical protein